jgi:hypothetical protein
MTRNEELEILQRSRQIIRLLRRIADDPATPPEVRAEALEEIGSVGMGCVGIDPLTDEELRQFEERERATECGAL